MGQNEGVILIIDDERDHADGIAESLEKLCARAIAVYDGTDALEIVRSQQIDVIVTDLKLGGDIDGLAILEEAKKYNESTEVILITAYGTIDTCKEAIKQGAYDYLVKPIDIGQLRTLVTQACQKASTANERRVQKPKASKEDFAFEGDDSHAEIVSSAFNAQTVAFPHEVIYEEWGS